MEDLLKIKEVAAMFRVSRQAVAQWIEQGLFPNALKIGKTYRIPLSDIEAFKTQKKAGA